MLVLNGEEHYDFTSYIEFQNFNCHLSPSKSRLSMLHNQICADKYEHIYY